jgi:hypothetical protein
MPGIDDARVVGDERARRLRGAGDGEHQRGRARGLFQPERREFWVVGRQGARF